ncbi:bifunctional riboflavin kinase/FAD synthetase [Aeoliella mucimassa]|uniref:Riboflavin biosynthesis protein n=1 Tax=Aeoliella mucimassa TaxID=2527972 RepID=A0A518AIS7_9BACT|nr:bifunctional riboflavin kinase/FAD synthetase [Aeoliella mucimassa]QDU54574.1 Riboflavin kinase [Aeoliella mucimassa]
MPIVRHVHDLPPIARGGAVTIGNFDGVHQGHARIVSRLQAQAEQVGGPAVVFTFDPHPARLLRPEACPPPLTWTERKADLLADLGIDWVLAYPTDMGLLSLSAREFFDRVILESLGAKAVVEGPNFFFGKNRGGNVETLKQFAAEADIAVEVVEPLEVEGSVVSSTRVRDLISLGRVHQAHEWLTAPYRIRGLVTHGAGRGTDLGFPTANLEGIDTLLPAHGVYAAVAWVAERAAAAAVNLGPNPTFGDMATKVEVHLIDCDAALYGNILEVDFLDRLRDTRPFASVDELKHQVTADVATAKQMANEYLAQRGRPARRI